MATVNYSFRGQTELGNLTVRFTHTRKIDLKYSTEITIPKKSWGPKRQRVKNTGSMKIAGKINEKLINLEANIISQFNLAHMEGAEINYDWLRKVIMKFFNRPINEIKKDENIDKVFFSDFCDNFCREILDTGKWKNPKTKKPLAYKSVQHYKSTVEKLVEYEGIKKSKVKHRDVDVDFCEDFCQFLIEEKKYSQNYTNKVIGRIKFFCRRAEESNIEINKVFKSKMFSAPTEQTIDPYLNENEIEQLFNHTFDIPKLTNTRDWLIIGCYTGLRVSDFLGVLSKDHIEDGFIHIKTTKTGENVTIPLHPKIKSILAKRNGDFPTKISSQKFNEYVKEVCKEAGIDDPIKASIKDSGTNRKVRKFYPKYKAISSHICRRSFATNHYGKIPTSIIMKIGGWRTETAFLKYLKKSSVENAVELNKYWENQVEIENQQRKIN